MKSFQIKSYSPLLNRLLEKYIRANDHLAKQRIISWIKMLTHNKRIDSSTKYGFKMSLDIDDLVQRTIFYNQEWEPHLTDFFIKNINHQDVYYDIGCNVGYYSLLAAKMGCEVFSFDPDPNNISVLKKNLEINSFTKIKTFEFGLGAENDVKTFYRANIANNGISGFNHINSIAELQSNIFTLDYLVYEKSFTKPTIIKIDTEGWEEKILLGASKLLAINPPKIIVFESEQLEENSLNDFKSIKSYLTKYNYSLLNTLIDAYGVNHIAVLNS